MRMTMMRDPGYSVPSNKLGKEIIIYATYLHLCFVCLWGGGIVLLVMYVFCWL